MKALRHALEQKLDHDVHELFKRADNSSQLPGDEITLGVSTKLDALAKILGLHPFTERGQLKSRLKPISQVFIESVNLI